MKEMFSSIDYQGNDCGICAEVRCQNALSGKNKAWAWLCTVGKAFTSADTPNVDTEIQIPDIRLLVQHPAAEPREAKKKHGPKIWAVVTHVGDPHSMPDSWLQPAPALIYYGHLRVNQKLEAFFLVICFSNKYVTYIKNGRIKQKY